MRRSTRRKSATVTFPVRPRDNAVDSAYDGEDPTGIRFRPLAEDLLVRERDGNRADQSRDQHIISIIRHALPSGDLGDVEGVGRGVAEERTIGGEGLGARASKRDELGLWGRILSGGDELE